MMTLRQSLVILLACSFLSTGLATECVKYSKRAPVKAVCGRIFDLTGGSLEGAGLTLTDETGATLFTVKSDAEGHFAFNGVPKGKYTIHGNLGGTNLAWRDIEVVGKPNQKCQPRIEITLGVNVCSSGVWVRGFDKPGDLDEEFKKYKGKK